MFYGHIGVGLASKPLAPKTSIGVLLIAATTIDTLWGIFFGFGMEKASVNAWTHGLFMSVIWSILAFIVVLIISRNVKISVILALLVFSHWILDFISHPMGMGKSLPKDLPLFFNSSPKVGLGLYNSVAAALISEFGLLAGGIVLYLKKTKAIDRTGKWAFAVLIVFLALFPLSAHLPSQLQFLPTIITVIMLPLGIWIDRHREYIA